MSVVTWQAVETMSTDEKIGEIQQLLRSAMHGVEGMAGNPMLRAMGMTKPEVVHEDEPLADSLVMLRALFETMQSMGQNRALSGLARTMLGS